MKRFMKFMRKRAAALLGCLVMLSMVPGLGITAYAEDDVASELSHQKGSLTSVLYDNKNGLPTSEANAIAETEDGFIWIGSYSGLIRYDGYNFVRIDSSSGIASVVSLFVDSKQRLWIGTNDSGLALMGVGVLQVFGKAEGLKSLSVRSITEADNGDIYVATAEGLYVLDENLGIVRPDIPEINEAFIYRLDKGADGKIYGMTKDGEAFIVADRKLEKYYDTDTLGIKGVAHAILMDRERPGYAYIGTQASEVCYGKFTDEGFEIETEIDVKPLEYINSVRVVDDDIWVCADNGVGSVTDGVFQIYNDLDLNNSMEDLHVDYQGNLWLISSKLGVMKIVENRFQDVTAKYGLEPSIATSTSFFDGKLFIGNKNGGITVLGKDTTVGNIRVDKIETASGEVLSGNNLIDILEDVTVRSIIRDSKDNIWISTYSRFGLIRYDGKNAVCYTEADGMPSNRVRVIHEDQKGDIIVGSIGGVVVLSDGKIKEIYDETSGIINNEILTVTETTDGRILAGTDGGGIYIIEGDKLSHIGTDDGLSSDIIMRIKKDPKRELYWVVTSNAIGYLDENLHPVVLRNFPYSNNFDLVFDIYDKVWVLSSNGIYVVPVSELIDNVSVYDYTFYDSSNGLPCIATANSYSELTDDGNLYMAGTTGVARVNINDPFEDVSTLKVDIPYVEVNGERIYADSNGVFNLGRDARKIEITGYVFTYSLMNPEITYYLEGFDTTKYTSKRSEFSTVSYTNLPGGDYRFVMQIRNAQGSDIKEYSINIKKAKAIYEYRAVRLLLIMLGTCLVALAVWKLMHITIISRQYEQIRVAKEEAERANTAKSRFLANMSHEIRTPINTIMGMNEMILREDPEAVPEEYLKSITGFAGNIKTASESLLELVNGLLDLSKIESGKMELVEMDYDTNEFLQSLAMMIRVRSNQKDLTFTTEIDETLPKALYGDRGKLKEILLNLLTNAAKYTESGGFTLILKVKEIKDDRCRIYFCVKDTGIGIKPEDMDHLFTAFKRLEEVKNSGIQGTGLGLDISKQFVQLMGGDLECSSVYGEGSEFFFTIEQKIVDPQPLGIFKEGESDTVKDKYVPAFVAPEGKVLVVDDNEMNLQVIKGLLKRTKLSLSFAQSGKECLEKVKEDSFHVVLLDHMMPGMDGIETLQHIREDDRDQVVIALTANIMTGGTDFYRNAGFNDYLSKPVDAKQLESMLAAYLPKDLMHEPSEADIPDADEEEAKLPSDKLWLHEIPDLNVSDGLKYCGNPEQFIRFIGSFVDTMDEKSWEIQTAFDEGDIKLYTIKVHALKSTARIMGAGKLSKLAESLEAAGNNEDLVRIEKDTPVLLEMYRNTAKSLMRIKEEDESTVPEDEKQLISEGELSDAYDAIRDFISQMDYDAVEMILSEIKTYKLNEKDKKIFDRLEIMLPKLDWDGMEELMKTV